MPKTMLLLFLSLFSNYDLFNCNQEGQPNLNNAPLTVLIHKSIRDIDTLLRDFQQEIHKEELELRTVEEENLKEDLGLLDYSVTPIWWKGTSGNDTAGHNTSNATFLPTPEGYTVKYFPTAASTINLWTRLNSLPDTFYDPSNPNKLDPGLEYFPYQVFAPGKPLTTSDYHDLPLTTTNYEESPRYSLPPEETSPPTTTARPTTPLSLMDTTVPSVMEDTTMPFASVHPPLLPALRGWTAKPITSSKFSTTLRATNMKVVKGRADDTPVPQQIKGNRITPKPRTLARTLSKAQAWVRDRRWTTTPTHGSSASADNGETVRLLRTWTPMSESTQTGYTGHLFHEDDLGFLYVSVPEVRYTTTSTRSTVAGDVLLYAKTFTTFKLEVTRPNEPYHDIMNATDEGYVMIFVSELAKLVVLKEDKHMQQVVSHAELIINKYIEENKLEFAGNQIQVAARNLGFLLTDAYHDPSFFKRKAMSLHLLLKERETTLSPEVNALIDYADMLFDDSKGDALFDALRSFEDYPNNNKTSWLTCFEILNTFVEPFRDLAVTERGQILLDNINQFILDRFGVSKVGSRKWKGDLVMRGGDTSKLDLSRLKKRYPLSLKKRTTMKRIRGLNLTINQKSNDDHHRQYYQTPWIPFLIPRSMLPITRNQKRFRVISPRKVWSHLNLNNERPTQTYRRRLSRPTHPPNAMMQFFPQVPVEIKRGMLSTNTGGSVN